MVPIRFVTATLILFCCAAAAHATVAAKVASIGFDSCIRPEAWVPLIIQTTSDEDLPHTYDLQVVQYDLDGEEVVYTRPGITINNGTQRFTTCFKPESINGGLPVVGGDNSNDLAKRLRIFLAEPESGRRSVQVATGGSLAQSLESGQLNGPMGQKLLVTVGRSPNVHEFAPNTARRIGASEDCLFVQADPKRLPESVLAYQAVDAVIWSDADPASLSAPQWRALREYVQGGGVLVVIQLADRARASRFDDMLPVTIGSVGEWTSLEPLHDLLTPPGTELPKTFNERPIDPWARIAGPFSMARATARSDAWVEQWVTWPDQTKTPYIARRLFGTGCVAWIAQDITEPAITTVDFGWPRLWEVLMDWHNSEMVFPMAERVADREKLKNKFETGVSRDLGASFLSLDLPSKTAALLTVAFVFFGLYWCIAGPGVFVFLSRRHQAQWSWYAFGAIAVAATLFTIIISQVVLRGAIGARHLSLVRLRCDDNSPAVIRSHMGLYVPRDERADISLATPITTGLYDISPLTVDPRYGRSDVRLRDSRYDIPISTPETETASGVSIPFRSTLKKLQADWSDPTIGRISGMPVLSDGAIPITGRIANDTNVDLKNVIMVFRSPLERRRDWMIAMKEWKHGQTLELADVWKNADTKPLTMTGQRIGLSVYDVSATTRGPWEYAQNWLYEDLRRSLMTDPKWDDSGQGFSHSFPLVSLFDRCAPMSNQLNETTRVDLFRRGVRDWNISPAVAAGAMVVIAQSIGPTPSAITVDGRTPVGTGQYFYQFVVPMDLTQINQPPTTTTPDPTTQPTSRPATN